jgi:putative sigma-54 modulation protein
MKLVLQGKNIELTDAIREYVQQKIEKAVSHFENFITEVDVHLSINHNPRTEDRQVTEVTIYANGTVIRAEESAEIIYASIDLVADKITRKLRKYKEKNFIAKKTQISLKEQNLESELSESVEYDLVGNREPELPVEVVRVKYFAMPPMTTAEAQQQLQMVDHDFYMFCNSATGEINVIYQRNQGGYGVIQPQSVGSSDHSLNGKEKEQQALKLKV